jgi:hypothetical protein
MSIVRNGQSTNRAMRSITQKKFSVSDHTLIVGGSGRLGGLLQSAWPERSDIRVIWQTRRQAGGAECVFDPLIQTDLYRRAALQVGILFNMAGPVGGTEVNLSQHCELALAALNVARNAGVRQVFLASSAAVYGATEGAAGENSPTRPVSPYGCAKLEMEYAARKWADSAGPDAPNVTCLRIGNVAGADQLLGDRSKSICDLDVLDDGCAPRRSYIGPKALASVLSQLFGLASSGTMLPFILNVALDGCVSMDALLSADRCNWRPRPADTGLVAEVSLDVSRLASLIDLPVGGDDARAIVADMQAIVGQRTGDTHDTVETPI